MKIESQNKYMMEGSTSQEGKPTKSWSDGGGEILKKGKGGKFKEQNEMYEEMCGHGGRL